MGQALARFVAFHDVSESDFGGVARPTFAVVIARSAGGILLVFNLFRKVWELPGGLIDADESARESAARELREESGCTARDLEWLGVVEVNDGDSHFGGVFACHVDVVPERFASDEIGAITSCVSGHWPNPLGHSDAELLNRFG